MAEEDSTCAPADMGRIYRVYPVGKAAQDSSPRQAFDRRLVAALDSPNGWQRDMVQQMLVWRRRPGGRSSPRKSWRPDSRRTGRRVQALWSLELLGGLRPELILAAMSDPHPGVRRHGVRLAEVIWPRRPQLGTRSGAGGDADAQVQFQRSYTLGQWERAAAAATWASWRCDFTTTVP